MSVDSSGELPADMREGFSAPLFGLFRPLLIHGPVEDIGINDVVRDFNH